MNSDKKKILILGATGMAGHVLYVYLNETKKYIVSSICHSGKISPTSYELDIYNTEKLKNIIEIEQPDFVINCIGILIKGSKSNPANAIYVNAYFPHKLSQIVSEIIPEGKVYHISTDCVFSGKKGGYYDTDEKDALDIYGMSKNLGELINGHDLTLRTSIIGPELKVNGEGLMHWIFSQREVGYLSGYKKSIWSGITTLELAKVVDACITADVTGLYQISNNIKITKYNLISLVVKEFNLGIKVNEIDGLICDKSIINTVLRDFVYPISSYETMIKEMHIFMDTHKELYGQYY